MERNTDYEKAKQNVTQFPSILWEKFNFFNQTGSTEDYKHSSYCHFDAYNELNSQNILLYKLWPRFTSLLWLLPYVKIMPWGELMAWLRQKNKKDSPWLVLSSPAIGKTHAMSSTHAMTLVHAVGNGNGGQKLWKIGRTHAATRQPHGHKKQWFWKNWWNSCHDPSTSWP